jgi:tetratricopeptide (TPR) repeat protein
MRLQIYGLILLALLGFADLVPDASHHRGALPPRDASCHSIHGQPSEEAAIRLPKAVAYYHYRQGRCARENREYPTAIAHFHAGIARLREICYPACGVEIALELARVYQADDDLDSAVGVLNEIDTRKTPESALAVLRLRAHLNGLNFRFDEAVADLDTAVALAPEEPDLYLQRGQLVMLLYEWDRVLENYNTALELDPGFANAYFHRGVLYYSVMEREKALADFEHYLTLAPGGQHAVEAGRYATSIHIELDALGE